MTLREYIAWLQAIVDADPKVLEFKVVYATDDEGNDFRPVWSNWTIWHYDDADREFLQYMDDDGEESYTAENGNAICIN